MKTVWEAKGEKLHLQHIDVAAYEYDGQRILVEGSLKDNRFHDTHVKAGETFPSGVLHHMAIRMLINVSNFMIEDIDADLKSVPREVCRETIGCLTPIKGLTITKGFTSKVKKLAGGNKGCTHLVELILAMAPSVFQGFGAYQSRKAPGFDPDRARTMLPYMINTCRIWRGDGPFAEMFKK